MILSVVSPVPARADVVWTNNGGTNEGRVDRNEETIDRNNNYVYLNNGCITENYGCVFANYNCVVENHGNSHDTGIDRNSGLVAENYGRIGSNLVFPSDISAAYNTWNKGIWKNKTDGVIEINGGAVGENHGTIDKNAGYIQNNLVFVGINRANGEVRNGDDGIVTNNFGTVTFAGANAVITNQYAGTVIGNAVSGAITNYFGGVVSGSSITVTNNFADITNDTHVAIQSAENQYRAVHFVAPEHSEVAYSSGFMTKTLMNEDGTNGDAVQYIKQGVNATITIAPEAGYTITRQRGSGRIETEDYAFDYEIGYSEYNVIAITISNYSGNSSSLSLADFGLAERMVAESSDDIHIFRWEKNDNGDYAPVEWTSDEDFRVEVSATDEYDLYLSFGVKNAWENTSGSYVLSRPGGIPDPSVDYLAPSPIASLSEDQAGMSAFVHICFNNAHIAEWAVSYSADSFRTTRTFTVAAKSVPAPDPDNDSPAQSGGQQTPTNNDVRTPSTDYSGSDSSSTKVTNPDGSTTTRTEVINQDGSKTVTERITEQNGNYSETITVSDAAGSVISKTIITVTHNGTATTTETKIYTAGGVTYTTATDYGDSEDHKFTESTYDDSGKLIEKHTDNRITKADGSVVEKLYNKDAEGKESYKATTAADGSYSGYHAVVDYASDTRTESTLDITADGAATISVLTELGDSSSEMSLSGTGSKVSLLKFATTEDTAVVPANVIAVDGKEYKINKIEAGAFAGSKATKLKLEGKATFKTLALEKSHISTLKVEKKAKVKFKKNCFKGCENMTIIVESKELVDTVKKQLKKSGAKNVKIKVSHSE